MVIDALVKEKTWSARDLEGLRIIANLLTDALTKLKAEKEIKFLAYYDHLTRLPNRFLFSARLAKILASDQDQAACKSLIFLDLDNFKSVNDSLGHKGGDLLLKSIARALKSTVRKTDLVCRFAGDEFLLFLRDIEGQEDLYKIVDKIMDIFNKPFDIHGETFKITASAGIACYPEDGLDAESLIKSADMAMYQAKSKGKNQYAKCSHAMKKEMIRTLGLSKDLHKALENDEFVLYYQPQIDVQTGEINGLEALIRWQHPQQGLIYPGDFIPLAEENRSIIAIGEWVLKTACKQNKRLQDLGFSPLRMGVNLSAAQFVHPRISEQIEEALRGSQLKARYLELEITEGIAIKKVAYAESVLKKFKDIGVRIAIDDFGTEYSSLSRLKELPIDRIKIDMQFIQGIDLDEKDRAITMIIINLAKSLRLNVIAEGVETLKQLNFLNQKMCDDIQGFYFHKPMSAASLEALLWEKNKVK